MIARLWSAIAAKGKLNAYLKHFSENVLPELKNCDGFAAAMLLTRDLGADRDRQARKETEKGAGRDTKKETEKEVLVTTYWKSMQSIEAFAGADREAAVVAPEAAALLRTFDKRVRHYAVNLADSSESLSIFSALR